MESSIAVTTLAALAQTHRLAIYRHLVRRGPEGHAVGGIREAVGLAPATLSHHLATLSEAGLIQAERQGRSIIYRADYAHMDALMGYLQEACCAESACHP